jgi:hypothetical protein
MPRGVGIGSGPGSGPEQAVTRDGAGLEHKAEGSTEAGEAEFEIGREERAVARLGEEPEGNTTMAGNLNAEDGRRHLSRWNSWRRDVKLVVNCVAHPKQVARGEARVRGNPQLCRARQWGWSIDLGEDGGVEVGEGEVAESLAPVKGNIIRTPRGGAGRGEAGGGRQGATNNLELMAAPT